MPSKKPESDKKGETHQKKSAAGQETVQPITRTVREGSFVHCYLACGHMITLHREDLKEASPSSMGCWACEEEQRETRRSLQ